MLLSKKSELQKQFLISQKNLTYVYEISKFKSHFQLYIKSIILYLLPAKQNIIPPKIYQKEKLYYLAKFNIE